MAIPTREEVLKALSAQIEQLQQFDHTEIDVLKAQLKDTTQKLDETAARLQKFEKKLKNTEEELLRTQFSLQISKRENEELLSRVEELEQSIETRKQRLRNAGLIEVDKLTRDTAGLGKRPRFAAPDGHRHTMQSVAGDDFAHSQIVPREPTGLRDDDVHFLSPATSPKAILCLPREWAAYNGLSREMTSAVADAFLKMVNTSKHKRAW